MSSYLNVIFATKDYICFSHQRKCRKMQKSRARCVSSRGQVCMYSLKTLGMIQNCAKVNLASGPRVNKSIKPLEKWEVMGKSVTNVDHFIRQKGALCYLPS